MNPTADMIAVQETTKWCVPNHVYILNKTKSKMFGYVKAGTHDVFWFGGPRGFDPTRRTFKIIPMPIPA